MIFQVLECDFDDEQNDCYCCSDKLFHVCCEPFLSGKKLPLMPEQLMRSRYSAFVLLNMNYIKQTMRDNASERFDAEQVHSWASSVHWLGLEVLATKVKNNVGIVEFIARYKLSNGVVEAMCEKSEFKRYKGRWYYVDSLSQDHKTMGTHKASSGRNAPCVCGSGKKYKHCCGG